MEMKKRGGKRIELVVNDTVAFLLLMIDNSNSIMQNVALLNISGNTHYT